jgi:hypothetical protein
MAPNLVGAGNQQSSRQETTTRNARLKVVPREQQSGTKAAHCLSLHHPPAPPNTRRRVANTVYGSSKSDVDIDTTAWRKRSLGYHAQRVTHRAFFAYTGRRTGARQVKPIAAQHGRCCELGERCQAGCAQYAGAQGKDGKSIL